MPSRLDDRVLVIGAGIAGLMTAYRLAQYGMRPLLIEKSPSAGNGSTTRNQGWLHAGTLHAQSISDPTIALKVSKRCQYGHSQFLNLCPEAIAHYDMPSIAVTKNETRIIDIVQRWQDAGVKFTQIPLLEAKRIASGVSFRDIKAAWLVSDAVIDTRILCTKLVAAIRLMGGAVLFETEVVAKQGNRIELASRGSDLFTIWPSFVIAACGYAANQLLQSHWKTAIPLRYWKSHLLITPRLMDANVFCLDAGESSLLHHGDKTVIGINEDNLMCDEPSHNLDMDQVKRLLAATNKLTALRWEIDEIVPIACIKVDVANDARVTRNLDIELVEIEPHLIAVFPGKMTEAPFLADIVVRKVLDDLDGLCTNPRPLDAAIWPARAPEEPRESFRANVEFA